MKNVLEFDLNEPDEEHRLLICLRARDMERALSEIREKLRQHEKYNAPAITLDDFWSILQDNDLGGLEI